METIQIPEQVETQIEAQIPDATEALVQTIAERWGYYFGKRTTQASLMHATSAERTKVRASSKIIKVKLTDYLTNGTDVRDEVNAIQGQLKKDREALSEKSKPFYDKISPLITALTYLDKVVIPQQIEQATGEKLLPKFQVADYTQKAIDAAKASK